MIKEIQGDGNCLYRAFADQLYGDENDYNFIKTKCFDYIEIEKEFFSQFIALDYDDYIVRKRRDGIWGDDVEIQALSEIYSKNVEIFSHSLAPLKTFHETEKENIRKIEVVKKEEKSNFPIRLSYHGKAHYNSIVPNDDYQFKQLLLTTPRGEIENKAIETAKMRIIEKEEKERLKKEGSTEKIELTEDSKKIEAHRDNFEKGGMVTI